MKGTGKSALTRKGSDFLVGPSNLRDLARVHAIDRHLFVFRLRRSGMKWVVLPGLGLGYALLLLRLLRTGVLPMPGLLATSLGFIAVGFGFLQVSRNLQDEVAELEAERCSLMAREEAS